MKMFGIIPTKTVAELVGFLSVSGVCKYLLSKKLFNGAIDYYTKKEKEEEP